MTLEVSLTDELIEDLSHHIVKYCGLESHVCQDDTYEVTETQVSVSNAISLYRKKLQRYSKDNFVFQVKLKNRVLLNLEMKPDTLSYLFIAGSLTILSIPGLIAIMMESLECRH